MEQINNAAFHPKAYEWEHEGRTHTRLVDGSATLNAKPLPDGSGIVVLQDPEIYGSDNVVVLDPAGEIRERIQNPYQTSKFFMVGDRSCFDAVVVSADEVVLNIQVQRVLPGKPYDALPIYEASYDAKSMKLLKLEWKPWT